MKAERLRVQVEEGERTKVNLTFSARLAEDLQTLLPQDVSRRLTARDIHLGRIARLAVAGDFAPGPLFDLMDGKDHIRAWLE